MAPRISEKLVHIAKVALTIINGVFILVGLAVIGLGIFFLLYKADLLSVVFAMERLNAGTIKIAAIIIIFCGALVLCLAFVGLCAATLLNPYLLIGYASLMVVVVLLSICAAVIGIVFKSTWYIDEVRQAMRDTLQKEYGVDPNVSHNAFITRTWDTVQQMWYCCAVEDRSWGIYRQSEWYSRQEGDIGSKEYTAKMVPKSCCKKDQYGNFIDIAKCQNYIDGPPNKQRGQYENEALLEKGCFEVGRDILDLVTAGVIGVGISLVVVVLLALVPAIILILAWMSDSLDTTTLKASAQYRPEARRPYPLTKTSYGNSDGNAYDNPYVVGTTTDA